jgi:hypothetical protein
MDGVPIEQEASQRPEARSQQLKIVKKYPKKFSVSK